MSVDFIFISKCKVLEAPKFKLAFIEQMKSNFREVFKEEIRQTIKEELKKIEKLSSAASLPQKHVNTLTESNVAPQEKCENNERLVECNKQYWRRTCTFHVKRMKRRKTS